MLTVILYRSLPSMQSNEYPNDVISGYQFKLPNIIQTIWSLPFKQSKTQIGFSAFMGILQAFSHFPFYLHSNTAVCSKLGAIECFSVAFNTWVLDTGCTPHAWVGMKQVCMCVCNDLTHARRCTVRSLMHCFKLNSGNRI